MSYQYVEAHHDRQNLDGGKSAATVVPVDHESVEEPDSDEEDQEVIRLKNSDILNNLDQKLEHFPAPKRNMIKDILQEFILIFPDAPGRTNAATHDVDVGKAMPIKQHAYRVNPVKQEYIRKEVEYMLQNGIVEPSQSQWSSPCVLVPKYDVSFRFCMDFRKLNALTKHDCHPIPRIDDCVDQTGSAQFVSNFDLLKGYWQVPLSERAKEFSGL